MNERKRKKTMRSTLALSRMRHTSHIPCHAQRAHLWAAKYGCKRTCTLHRQIERAIHTEKKKNTDMLNMFMYRDVRNPTSQNNYSVAAAWNSEEACSLKLTVYKIRHKRVPKHLCAVQLEQAREIHTRYIPTGTTHYGPPCCAKNKLARTTVVCQRFGDM